MREDTGSSRERGVAPPDAASGRAAAGEERADGARRHREERAPSVSASPPLDKVDDASDDSFPASDAPAWTGIRVGSPRSDR
jgi:hypothetical protein